MAITSTLEKHFEELCGYFALCDWPNRASLTWKWPRLVVLQLSPTDGICRITLIPAVPGYKSETT